MRAKLEESLTEVNDHLSKAKAELQARFTLSLPSHLHLGLIVMN